MHLVLHPVRLPLLPLDLGLAKGVEVSLDVRLLLASAPLSLQLLRELQRGRLLGRSGLPLPAPLPRLLLPHSSQHAPRRDELREVSVDRSLSRSSRVSRSSDRGTRKDRRARSWSDSSRDRGRRSHSAYRSRSEAVVFSVAVLPRASRDLRIAPAPVEFALALGETGLDPRIDTALDVTGRGPLTATDPVDSVRDPLLAGEVAVTVRSHAIFFVVFVTARGPVDDLLPPLTVRGQRREDSEPDMSSRRVWRRLLSPRLLLSLKRLL